jgi:hypothetical protein
LLDSRGFRSSTGHLLYVSIYIYEYSAYPERGHSIATQVTGKPTGLYYRYRGFSRGQCPAEDSVLYSGLMVEVRNTEGNEAKMGQAGLLTGECRVVGGSWGEGWLKATGGSLYSRV